MIPESLDLFKSMLQETTEEIYLVEPDGRLVYVNPAAAGSLGYTIEELLAQGVPGIDPDFGPRFRERFQELKAEKSPSFETVHIAKDGRRVPKELRPVYLLVGGKEFAFVIGRDITERKKAEAELRSNEERYRTILKTAMDGFWLSDTEGRLLEVNDAYCRMSGYSAQELLTMRISDLDVNETAETLAAHIKEDVAKGTDRFESRHRRKDGSIFDVEVSLQYHPAEGGRGVIFLRDITERKKTEAELEKHRHHLEGLVSERTKVLRESEARFRQMIAQAPLAMAIVGLDGTIEYINQKAVDDFGYPHREIPNMDRWWVQAYPDEAYRQEVMADWGGRVRQALERGGDIRGNEYRVTCKDGAIKVMYIWGTIVAHKVLVMFNDITERTRLLASEQKARNEAEDANRAKDDLLAVVSHELRTPLTTMQGLIWLLRSGGMSLPEREDALATIQHNMEQEKQIIDDLLDIAGLQRHQMLLKRQVLELGQVVSETAESFKVAAREHSLRLCCEPAAGLRVDGDAQRLRQVFSNLLSNAIKFTPAGGTVTISMNRERDRVLTSVEDTGPGIAAEFVAKLFEPFTQQEASLTRAHGGLGLGLNIVKRLVELHGGTVWAEAPVPGRGAKLTVSLPLCAPSAQSTAAAEPGRQVESGPTGVLHGIRILLIDDNKDTLKTIARVLEHFGAEVRGACSAAEGYAAFRQEPPDVLICDLSMPGEDGFSLIKRVRALPPQEGGRTPAAALTGYAAKEDRDKVLRADYQIFIPKPVDPEKLAELVFALAQKVRA